MMGIFKISLFLDFKLSPSFLFIIIIITSTLSLIVQSTKTVVHNEDNIINPYISSNTPPPQPPLDTTPMPKSTPFRPSIAVFVGLLTIIVCFTFLILLYAKHCRGGPFGIESNHYNTSTTRIDRINSGVERTVVESLPTFRFNALRGQKDGLECAVCLNKFEPTEVLRLLPKCKHAFHVECLDTWLDIHSTCPLCRYRVHAEDVLLVDHSISKNSSCSSSSSRMFGGVVGVTAPPTPPPLPTPRSVRNLRVGSGDVVQLSRHSSPGERGSSSFLEVIAEQPSQGKRKSTSLLSSKRSLDGWKGFIKKPGSFNKTSSSRLSGTRSLDSTNNECLRKDGLLLDIKNNNSSSTGNKNILLPGVRENGVEQQPPPPRQGEGSGGGGIIRHSSAGETGSSSLLKVIAEKQIQNQRSKSTSFFSNTRRSFDGWMSSSKKSSTANKPTPSRLSGTRSLDCDSDRRRKDGLLLLAKKKANSDEIKAENHRLDHMIIIGGPPEVEHNVPQERWSDVQPSELLYLESEMILSKSSVLGQEGRSRSSDDSKVINDRSVSEMTGLSRYKNHEEQQRCNSNNGRDNRQSNNVRGALSRWKSWISISKPESVVQQNSSSGVIDTSASTSSNIV